MFSPTSSAYANACRLQLMFGGCTLAPLPDLHQFARALLPNGAESSRRLRLPCSPVAYHAAIEWRKERAGRT